MSVFQLLNSPISEVDGATKLYDIQAHPIETNNAITNAREIYHKKKLNAHMLLSDVYQLRAEKWEKYPAHNAYKHMIQQRDKVEVESGRSEYETAFMFGAMQIKNQLPTDIINGLFYQNRSDNSITIDYLLPLLRENTAQSNKVLIILPAPDLILTWNQAGIQTVYAVYDKEIKGLYQIQFSNIPFVSFITFDEIATLSGIDIVMLTSNSISVQKSLELLCSVPVGTKKIFALLPSTAFSECTDEQMAFCSNQYRLNEILLLPAKVCVSIPHKKIIAYFSDTPADTVSLHCSFIKDNQLFMKSEVGQIAVESVFQKETLKAQYKKAISAPKKLPRDYDKSKAYFFSEEITLNYTTQIRDDYYVGKAYYCSPAPSSNRKHGDRLSRLIEAGLRSKTEQGLTNALERLPFSDANVNLKDGPESTLADIIVRELYERFQSNFSELSLKTIWFILRERLNPPKNKDSNKNPYKDEIAQYLFCGSIQNLSRLHPLHAEIEEIQDAMEAVLQNQEDDARLKYWLQLDLIFKAAVKAGILDRNPVQYIIASVSKRATDRQREIRNAMTKKNLETDEENRLLELLSAPTQNPQDEQSFLPLYVIDSKALLLAVRFFTGLNNAEACALTFGNILHSKSPNLVQFRIDHSDDDDYYIGQKETKFRFVPLVQPLVDMFNARKDYIQQYFGIDFSQKSIPLFYETEPTSPDEVLHNKCCTPKTSAKFGSAIIKKLGLPQQLLVLPGDEYSADSLTIDLFKYQGDIIHSNFKFHANHDAAFTMGELSYYLGIQPPDTYSCHYCDYSNEFIQYGMKEKLLRWTVKHPLLQPKYDSAPPRHMQMALNGTVAHDTLPQGGYPMWSTYQITVPKKHPAEIAIQIEAEHGFAAEYAAYWKERIT